MKNETITQKSLLFRKKFCGDLKWKYNAACIREIRTQETTKIDIRRMLEICMEYAIDPL